MNGLTLGTGEQLYTFFINKFRFLKTFKLIKSFIRKKKSERRSRKKTATFISFRKRQWMKKNFISMHKRKFIKKKKKKKKCKNSFSQIFNVRILKKVKLRFSLKVKSQMNLLLVVLPLMWIPFSEFVFLRRGSCYDLVPTYQDRQSH